ncbi:MAG: beta-ketoacyl synthase N-terminal-like domain-containing protein [Sporichthyaceae bacterium]
MDVAIVGMAAVFPGAPDVARFAENIFAGVDAIADAPADRWDPAHYDPAEAKTRPGDRLYSRRGGFIAAPQFDPMRFGIMPMAVGDIEADQLIALATAAAAIEDAGGDSRLGDRGKIGIVLGRGGYFNSGMASFVDRVRTANQLTTTLRELLPHLTEDQLEAVRASFAERLGPLREESGIDLMVPNLVASRTANRLDLAGPAYTVDAACASSLIAVDHAVRELSSGRCDVMLAGGVHHCHDLTFWSGFNLLGALSPSDRIRPFHRNADGILIGEGTGILVLKRLADAGDDRVYAVIRGVGVAGDGRSSSLMAPRSEGQVAAMRQAWAMAGLDPTAPDAVGLVEAHGTATVAGDATELASLTEVFGPRRDGGADIGLGSVKSMIGHAMPAAGAAGLIKAALAVHRGELPPTLHCDDPHPAMAGSRFAPVTAAAPWEARGTRVAAVNAFGFGGINAHVVLSERPTRTARGRRRPTEPAAGRERVLLLAAPDLPSLAQQLAAPDATLLARDDAAAPPAGGPVRLALVAPDAKRIALARKVVEQGKPWAGRSDLWLSTESLLESDGTTPRVAFLFPGLEEVFEPRVDDVAAHFGLPPVRSTVAAGLGRRGLELAAVGRLLDAALRALDIEPDVVAGHSIGEWSALIAAGAASFEEFADSTRSFDAGPGVPDLVYAVLGCGATVATAALEGLPDVVLSHDNCPNQSIVCGEEGRVEIVLARLREQCVSGSVLPFRSGFHTHYLEPFLGPTRDFVRTLAVRPQQVPLWSATTAEPYPDDDAGVRDLLVRNLVEPVRFGPLVQRLHAAGVRAFVQVGTGSLPGFVEDTLETSATPHLALSANVAKRTGLEQLLRVAAALWTVGANPRFARLDAGGCHPPAPDEPDTSGARLVVGGDIPHDGRPGIPLRMGAPLLRELAAPLPAAAPGPFTGHVGPISSDPVIAEYQALLAETAQAAGAVLAQWRGEDFALEPAPVEAPLTPQPVVAPAAPAPPTAAPGARSKTTTRVLSVASDPHLLDHCLLQAPEHHPVAERFPIVPMTATIELITDAAADLVPERTVIGVRGVRALRPLAIDPEITLSIEASAQFTPRGASDGELTVVTVVVEGAVGSGPRETYARGTVLLADRYPAPPALREPPLSGERDPGVDAHALYADRWMFHGPAYQSVVELTALAEDGVRGVVEELPAPGSLLDAAGQLLGFWVAKQLVNGLVLPATIGAVSFYGPPPEPGDRFEAVVRVRSATVDEAVADLALRDSSGRLWCHITGWTDRRLETDERTIAAFRHPAHATIATEQDGGWWLLAEPWTDPAARDLAARQYLGPEERPQHASRNPRAANRWLLGRIAAKDALRAQLWVDGAGPLFPAEVRIDNDPSGRPFATGAGSEDLQVSLAHSGPFAVALVGPPGTPVGIDVELVDDAPAEAALLTPAERALLDALAPAPGERAAWVTRFWTAKEAVAKALGTGLGGRPARFVVTSTAGDELSVVVDGAEFRVATRTGTDPVPFAVGWTRRDA